MKWKMSWFLARVFDHCFPMLHQWDYSFFLLDDFVVQCNLVDGLVPVKAGVHVITISGAVFWLRRRHGSLSPAGRSVSVSATVVDAEGALQPAVSALGGAVLCSCRFSSARVAPFLLVYLFSGFLLHSPLEEGWRLGYFLPSPLGLLQWLGHELRPGEAAWLCGFGFQIHLLWFRLQFRLRFGGWCWDVPGIVHQIPF